MDKEPITPPPSRVVQDATVEPMHTSEMFIPTRPHVGVNNSVVVEAARITPYLDSALKNLGLHTEARTSFITYVQLSFCFGRHKRSRHIPQILASVHPETRVHRFSLPASKSV